MPKNRKPKPGDAQRSPGWRKKEKEHLAREPVCQYCGASKHLQVHHKLPFHLFPEKELDPENLITLCEPPGVQGCHEREGHLGNFKEGYNLTIREDCEEHRKKVANRKTGGRPAKKAG